MWHEARKQEKLIKGMIVDYRRRAERRRDFYEKIKADPTQFLQVHGRPCKIHLDPVVAAAGESAAIMMPWQGDTGNMIDRFDVRAHLDYIPEVSIKDLHPDELSYEERHCNYERYRILAQNMFLGISEEKFLHQLSIEEKYGVTLEEKEAQREKQGEKKGTGVAIGFDYDAEVQPVTAVSQPINEKTMDDNVEDSDDESDPEIIDVDLSIDVNKIETSQAHAMNGCGTNFGMPSTDFFSFLTGDAEEAEKSKQLMREEKEKALFSGRKSRRERRAHRDKKLALRVVSPPHYAARPPSPRPVSLSPARSPSPAHAYPQPEKITFITSFGGEDEMQPMPPAKLLASNQRTYASALKDGRKNMRTPSPKRFKKSPFKRSKQKRISSSRSRSRSGSRSKLKSKSRSPMSKSKSLTKRRSKSSSSSRSRSRRRSRSSSSRHRHSSKSSSSDNERRNSKSNYYSNSSHSNLGSSQQNSNTTSHIPKYYGRKRDGIRSSSSELSIDSESDDSETRNYSNKDKMAGGKSSHVSNILQSTGGSSKLTKEKITAKERLKRKMQAQLSRQLRADMKAEAEKQEREQLMQQERDDEMRELAIKIRRRQRELRHQRTSHSSDDGSSSPHQDKRSRSPRRRSPDKSSEEDEVLSRKDDKERRSPEKYKKSPSRSRTSWDRDEGHSSRYSGNAGLSDRRGDSRSGKTYSDHHSSYRKGHYDHKSSHGDSYQSRSHSRYTYRRDDDGRSGFSERSRSSDRGKSGRHWHGRNEHESSGHRGHSDRVSKHSDSDDRKHGRRDDMKDDYVIKYSDRKLVDY